MWVLGGHLGEPPVAQERDKPVCAGSQEPGGHWVAWVSLLPAPEDRSSPLHSTSGAHAWAIQMVAAGLDTSPSLLKSERLKMPPEVTAPPSPLKMSTNSIKSVDKWKRNATPYTSYAPGHNSKKFAMYYFTIICHGLVSE